MIEIRHVGIRRTGDSQQAYDALYNDRPIDHPAALYQWFAGLASASPSERILDVSCGAGGLLLIAEATGASSYGIDISLSAIRKTRARGLARSVVADAECLPFPDNSFDVVTNLGSLEHYDNMEAALAETHRVVRSGGRAVFLMPNTFALTHVLHAWRVGDAYDDGQPIQRYNTELGWRRMLEGCGLRVDRIWPYETLVPKSLGEWTRLATRPRRLVRLLMSVLLPLTMANSLVFTCTKH